MKKLTLEQLQHELMVLAGVPGVREEGGVDFYVEADSLTPSARSALAAASIQRPAVPFMFDFDEEEDDTVDEASETGSSEALKGSFEGLSERMKGLVDFVDQKKIPTVVHLLTKIIRDAADVLKSIPQEAKKQTAKNKQSDKALSGLMGGSPQPAQGDAGQQNKQQGGAGKSPPQVGQQGAASQQKESKDCFMLSAPDVGEDAAYAGFGKALMTEVRFLSGVEKTE